MTRMMGAKRGSRANVRYSKQGIAEAARFIYLPRLAEDQVDCLREGARKEPESASLR